MTRLKEAATDVWFLRVDAHGGAIADAQLAWLTDEEHDRARRFRFERDRRLYLSSRVLIRGLLSRYVDLPPGAWRFQADGCGKPSIANPGVTAPAFSLAHTHGLVCCAFSGFAVGVDAEALDRSIDVAALWSACCSPLERVDLEGLDDRDRRTRFLSYWTLKESLSKAIGCGLTMDVSRLSFQIDADRIRVAIGEPWDRSQSWQFALFHPTPGHTVAVSVGATSTGALPIRLCEAALARLP